MKVLGMQFSPSHEHEVISNNFGSEGSHGSVLTDTVQLSLSPASACFFLDFLFYLEDGGSMFPIKCGAVSKADRVTAEETVCLLHYL
jgi:hypothetical protein